MGRRWGIAAMAWLLAGVGLTMAALDGAPPAVTDSPVSTTESADAPDETPPVADVEATVTGYDDDLDDDPSPAPDDGLTMATTPATVPPGTEADGLAARWELSDGEDLLLLGYSDGVGSAMTLPVGWRASSPGLLTGTVATSSQARDDTSLRIDVAGRPIGSWTVGDVPSIQLPVALDTITEADIDVDFVATTPLNADQICPDPQHVARWLEVEQPAVLGRVTPDQMDVTRAIRGIGTVSTVTGEPVHLITTGPPTAATLETIGNLVSAVGHYGVPLEWSVRFDGRPPDRPGAQIWIDERSDATPRVSVRVVDHRPRLDVVGEAWGLLRLTEALSDPDRIDFFHYTRVALDDIPAGAQYPIREVFRFEDDGYDDRTLRGSGHQSLIYRVHIPAGVPPDLATLAIYATHSPSMAAAESTVTVRINGSPEEIVAVVNPSGQLEALHTIAPADLRPGLNYVKVSTQLVGSSTGAGACGGARGSAWFTISNSSAVGVERTPEPQPVRLGVEDARFALATPIDFNTADVTVPNQYGTADIELAAQVISQLSNRAQGGSPRLVVDDDADRTRHLVVVGADMGRDLLESVPKVVPGGAAVNETTIAAQALGMVAAQPSPFAVGRVMLAFTGATREGAARGIEVAMSSDVNDVNTPFALISPDDVRPLQAGDSRFADRSIDDEPPGALAYGDEVSGSFALPEGEEYDQWVLDQAARIEAAQQPERDQRRIVALSLLVLVSLVAGLWWIQRTRRSDRAGSH